MVRIAIIAGTGLGNVIETRLDPGHVSRDRPATPFGEPSDDIVLGEFDGTPVALLRRHGEGHRFNPTQVPYRANIFALKALGCTHVIASGATGSLREHIHPGSLVLCNQIIDRTIHRPRTFYEDAAVHVELADPTCPIMREWLLQSATGLKNTLHETGTYICMEGPAFSTRAESAMHRAAGGDVVGMTAMPECRLAREAELAYALIALPTDYDCWKDSDDQDGVLEVILGNLEKATEAAASLLEVALREPGLLESRPSPAHVALDHAIWTDQESIKPDLRQQLAPLWGRVLAG